MVQLPVFQPPGTLVVSEATEGHRTHERLLQVGGSWAQFTSGGRKVPQKDKILSSRRHWRTPPGLERCFKKAKPLYWCSGAHEGWQ